jgi:hypothetical protein
VLRALAHPSIEAEGTRTLFPEAGSRDALCGLIGEEVKSVEVHKGDCIELETRAGHTLTIPLDQANRRGPESAHFVPADRHGRPLVEEMLIW